MILNQLTKEMFNLGASKLEGKPAKENLLTEDTRTHVNLSRMALRSKVSEMEFPPFWGKFQMNTSTIETDSKHSQQLFFSHDRCQKSTLLHLYRLLDCIGLLNYPTRPDGAHFQDIYSPDFLKY